MTQPAHPLRSFAGLFVATYAAQAVSCVQPLALLLAALAAHRYALLGPRWRPSGSLVVMATVLPGGISCTVLADLLGLGETSKLARGASQLGTLLLVLWWLSFWGRELELARRRLRLCAVLVGVAAGALALSRLLGTLWAPPGGWPEHETGFSAGEVPLSMLSTPQAAALIGLFVVVLFSAAPALFLVPGSVWRVAATFSDEPAREPPEGAVWFEAQPRARRHGSIALLGVALLGSAALTSNLLFVPWAGVPSWLLAPLPWALAAWLARRWLEVSSGSWVAPAGVLADNRLEPWSELGSWDASHDRFTLHGRRARRAIPIGEDDPRRAVVEAWITGAPVPADGQDLAVASPTPPPPTRTDSRRRRTALWLMIVAALISLPWWGRALWRAASAQADHVRVVSGLRQISAAQARFKALDPAGAYGSLEQLRAKGLASKESLPGGIFFMARTTRATPTVSWWAAAAPFDVDGAFQAFYTNETGQLWTLTLQAREDGWSLPTPDDFGDVSTPPPGATLYSGP